MKHSGICTRIAILLAIITACSIARISAWEITNTGDVTFSGRAVVTFFTNNHAGPEPIIIGDTGQLPPTGGDIFVPVIGTNVLYVLAFNAAYSETSGSNETAMSCVGISNYFMTFRTTNFVDHTLSFTSLVVCASATRENGQVVLQSQLQITGLQLDGQPVNVTGESNQVVNFIGGYLLIHATGTEMNGNTGQIFSSGLFLHVNNDITGWIGYVEADVTCPPQVQPCERVTGGGWIRTAGGKATFGLEAAIQGQLVTGHLTYIDHRGTKVQGQAISYSIGPDNTRTITYSVRIKGRSATAIVQITDAATPKGRDTFRITLSTGYSAGSQLGGGNIQIHQCPKPMAVAK